MTFEIKPHSSHCSLKKFTINGVDADYSDFGEIVDTDPGNAPTYGCGNRQFQSYPTNAIDYYKINESEYEEICDALKVALAFGSCAACA